MLDRIKRAIVISYANGRLLLLITLIPLTAHLLLNACLNHAPLRQRYVILSALAISSVLYPLIHGPMVYALYRIHRGKTVTYHEALRVGISNWLGLFKAYLFMLPLLLVGCCAFFIPGVLLTIRFSMVDIMVVIEGTRIRDLWRRSGELTHGIGWSIFASGLLLGTIMGGPVYLAKWVMQPVMDWQQPYAHWTLQAVIWAMTIPLNVLIFLFYWDSGKAQPMFVDEYYDRYK